MKRTLTLILALLMTVSLAACGGGTTTVVKKEPDNSFADKQEEQPLSLEQKNSVENYIDFTLVKIQTSKKIEAAMSGGLYYENSNTGETYIDVILEVTNTGTEAISSEDVITAIAVNASGSEYTNTLYVVETDSNSNVSQYESIAPLSAVRLHCGISVPENETELTIKLNINGSVYACDYKLGETLANTIPLAVGQSVEDEDYASIQLQSVEYTSDLLPSNTSSYYTHYEVDNADNIYLVTKFDVTNYQGTAKQQDSFVSVKAVYMDKYTYTGFVVVEDTDGEGFGRYESIDPLSTRHLFVLIEVPKVVMDKPAELSITFNGKEYSYTHSAA